jgi:Domain of unknown function (DUF4118)
MGMTGFLRAHRDRLALSAALIVPPIVCAALIPARATLPNTDAALVLVAASVALAALGNRTAGWLASVCAAVWFDFFLTVPYERLTITRTADLQTTGLLLLVGAAVTEIAVLARRKSRTAAADEALLAVVQSTGALVARGETDRAVVEQVTVQLTALLGAQGAVFEPGDARVRGLCLRPDGTLAWGGAVWNLAEHGFPNEPVELPARHAGRIYGRFVLTPTPGAAPGLESRRVAVVLADLVGAALSRDGAHHRP